MFKLNNLKNYTPFVLFISVLLINTGEMFAQGPPPPPPPPGLPIDGGLLFLAASALVYGVRNIKKN